MQGEVIDSVIKMNIRISVSRSAHPVSTQSYVAFRSLYGLTAYVDKQSTQSLGGREAFLIVALFTASCCE